MDVQGCYESESEPGVIQNPCDVTDTDNASYSPDVSLELDKQVGLQDENGECTGPWYDANASSAALQVFEGVPVCYRLVVENTGQLPLTNLTWQDDPYWGAWGENPYQFQEDVCAGQFPDTLEPGETTTCIYEVTALDTEEDSYPNNPGNVSFRNRAKVFGEYGDVTWSTNTDVAYYATVEAPLLTLEKAVINDNGGMLEADAFTLHVNGGAYDGSVDRSSGDSVVVQPGVLYEVNEDAEDGYEQVGINVRMTIRALWSHIPLRLWIKILRSTSRVQSRMMTWHHPSRWSRK